MHTGTYEYWIVPFQVFLEKSVHEPISLRIRQVQMVHSILLAPQFRIITTERQCMRRRVYFRNHLYKILCGLILEINEFFLGVISVTGCQARKRLTLQTESRVCLVPVMIEKLLETVVVQMNMQHIHLIVRQHSRQIAQIRHRNELTSTINHKTTHPIIRIIADGTFRQLAVVRLLADLKQGSRGPIHTNRLGSAHPYMLGHRHRITFLSQFLVLFDGQEYIPVGRLSGDDLETLSEHLPIIIRKKLRHLFQFRNTIHDTHVLTGNEKAVLPFPFLQFRNDKRLRVPGTHFQTTA